MTDKGSAAPSPQPTVPDRKRGLWALAVLAGIQLLIVVDASIVNVALPAIRDDVGFSLQDLQWVITAYTLAFGGLLLLGGRLADRFGRRRMLVAGALVFAGASFVGGCADTAALLVATRAVQGVGAAVMAPAALALLMRVFPAGRERTVALGVWAGVTAGGTALGLILGGVLTQVLSWPWVFWINVPVAITAAGVAVIVLPAGEGNRADRIDVAGALTVTGGVMALVYGLVRTTDKGWASTETVVALVAALVLLAVFGALQVRLDDPLVPVRLLRNRTVLGADVIGLIFGVAIYAVFYFLSIFLATVLGYSPVRVGLAFLPMTVAIALAARVAGGPLAWVRPHRLAVGGSLLVALGVGLLMRIGPGVGYVGTVLPGVVLAGLGLGLAFVPLTAAAVSAADPADGGIASALFNAGQQLGGAIGLAVLTTASAGRTSRLVADGEAPIAATVAGWSFGFGIAAVIALIGAVVAAATFTPAAVHPMRGGR
ncbi:MFS transporter [Rhodococcus erythropolis]|uniref:MFS transporter n=1 Tax=Rhodococcus erythropolis TaxID=1833 RepID=UPI0008A15D42|nr:MFS transporter [Rhodococcus erythropolis]MBT1258300.1 MFS transporter [Rhodococcus erythropolis]OHF24869.1 MFS transporter [Rhodococcus erythropolis]